MNYGPGLRNRPQAPYAGMRGGPLARVGAGEMTDDKRTTWEKIKDGAKKRYAGIPLYAWVGGALVLTGIGAWYFSSSSGDRHRHHRMHHGRHHGYDAY